MTPNAHSETYISQFSFLEQADINILMMLNEDPRVDKTSYFDKLQQIQDNLKSLENAKDLITELKAASEFASMPTLNNLKFDENPDFRVQILNNELAVEVKNFRYRVDDSRDDALLKYAGQHGTLVAYGDPSEVQTQIEDAIAKKVRNYHGTEALFLYFWSHSSHHVEDLEIECATKTILYDKRYSALTGLFYKFNNHTTLVYPARNQEKHIEIFADRFSMRIL